MSPPGRFIATSLRQLTRRPALPVAGAFIGGIFAHPFVGQSPGTVLVLLSCATVSSLALVRRATFGAFALLLAVFLSGMLLGHLEMHRYPHAHISQFATDTPRLANLEISIDRPPRVLTAPFDARRPLPPKQVTLASIVRINTWDGWQDATGKILVQLSEPHPMLQQGQIVRVMGMLQRPAPAQNPGQFDWAKYYREQRILASLTIPHAKNVKIIETRPLSVVASLRQQTRQLLAGGFSPARSLDHALLRALLLGDSDPELRDVQEQFRKTGTSHHLAISGMHVAVLGGVVYFFCRLICLSPRLAAGVMIGFVILYGIVALPSPPVVRSVLLCVTLGIGVMMGRGVDAIQCLSISVLAMLLYQPLDLYNAGFQLSFLTVLGLMLLSDPLTRAMRHARDDPDARVAASFVGRTRFAIFRGWIDDAGIATLAAGLVAWAVSMPLIALHFNQLNPWAIVGSILLAPFVFIALVGGMAKVLLTLLWPTLAPHWASAAARPVDWMRAVVEWLGSFPASDVPLPAPSTWAVVGYLALLVLSTRPFASPLMRWTSRIGLAGFTLTILLFPYLTDVARLPTPAGELRVTLLSVGAGQCAVVEPPGGRITLVDAGSTSLPDLLRKCVAPFLRHRGITDVDTLLLSHANIDHFSACAEIVQAYDAREILVGNSFLQSSTENDAVETLLRELVALDRPPRVVVPGDVIPIGRDTSLQILWPPRDCALDANNTSMVVRLQQAGKSILFTGDIQDDAMRELLKSPDRLRSDILIAPHHGSSESLTRAFVNAVDPGTILCSNDRTLTNKQRVFERMVNTRQVLRTNVCGAISITVSATGEMRIEPFIKIQDESASWQK